MGTRKVCASEDPVWVGLDYHRRRTQVCVVGPAGETLCNRSVPSRVGEIAGVIESFGRARLVAIESCSGSAQLAHELIERAGLPAKLCHPGYAGRMRHNPDKSDLSDARLLAELARVGFLPEVWLAPEPVRDLRSVVQFRAQLVGERKASKVRILALLRERRVGEPEARRWTRAWTAWLREHAPLTPTVRWLIDEQLARLEHALARIRVVERRLAEMTRDDPVVNKLLAMPGVGPVTAWTLRADVGRFDRFATGKQLARYCGLSPRNASSGERVADAGLVKAGRARLRAVLVQAAHRLVRHDARWKALFGSLRERGKPASVAVAAVTNRWVRWLHHHMLDTTRTTTG